MSAKGMIGHPDNIAIIDSVLEITAGDLSALREVCARVVNEIAEEYGIADIELIDGLSAAATDIHSGEWTPEVLK